MVSKHEIHIYLYCNLTVPPQVLIMDQADVRSHYLHTWFFIDVIAAFPLDLLIAGNRIDVLRLPRVLKVFCISRLPSFRAATRFALRLPFVADMNQFHTRILRLLLTCLLWVHFDACLLYGAAVAQNYPECVPVAITCKLLSVCCKECRHVIHHHLSCAHQDSPPLHVITTSSNSFM